MDNNSPPNNFDLGPDADEVSAPATPPPLIGGDTVLPQSRVESVTDKQAEQMPLVSAEILNKKSRALSFALAGFVLGTFVLVGIIYAAGSNTRKAAQKAADSSQIASTQIPLEQLSKGSISVDSEKQLSINGILRVNGSFVITPSDVPSTPTKGQLYLNQANNLIYYYNGSQFVNILNSNETLTSLFNVGAGLSASGKTLANTGVLSLQGQTGNVSLGAGSGIGINGTTITNAGVTGLAGTANQVAVSGSTGNLVLSLPQDIGTGSTPTFAGLNLAAPLSVSKGGSGAASLSANGVLVGNGTSPVTAVTAGSPNLCLMSTGGAPNFQVCPGGSASPVSSLDTLTGDITIANSTGSGTVVTIDDASTAAKGIAQFNATNFSVGSGIVNTIQGIGTSASPTFAGLTLSSALTVGNGGTGSTTAAGARANLSAAASWANSDITSLSGLTTALSVLQGGTGSTTAAGARSNLSAAASGANSDITSLSGLTTALSVLQGGTGATTAGGARTNLGAAASGSNSDITSLSGLTTALSVGQGGTGSTTASGARSNLSAAASGSNSDITILSALTSIAPSAALTVGATGQNLTLQGATTTLSSTSGGITNSLVFTTPSGSNKTITIPNVSGTVCLDSGNCLGGPSGSANTALSNLSSVAINTTLLPGAAGTVNLGSGVLPFGDLYVAGTSGTPGTNNFKVTGASTSGTRTITLPDSSGTVCLDSGNCLGGSGGGAKTDLSNLSSVAINTSLLPGSSNSIDTGSASFLFRTGYFATSLQAPLLQTADWTAANTANLAIRSGNATVGASLNSGNITLDAGSATGTTGTVTIGGTNASALTLGRSALQVSLPGGLTTNGSNLTTAGGTVNTATISGGTLTSTAVDGLSVSATAIDAPGALSIGASTATLTIGRTAAALTLQGSASSVFKGTSGANTTTLAFTAPTANVTLNLPALTAGTYDICTTGAVCSGYAAGSGDGSYIFNQSSLQSSSNFHISGTGVIEGANALTLGVTGTNTGATLFKGSTAASGTITLAGPNNPSTNTLTLPNETGTLCSTGSVCSGYAANSGDTNYIFNQSSLQSSSNFHLSGSGTADTSLLTPSLDTASAAALTIGGTNASSVTVGKTTTVFTLQGTSASVITGKNGSFTTTLGFGTPTANVTLNLPVLTAGTYNICTSANNCSSSSTLQTAYDSSTGNTTPEITLNNGGTDTGGIDIQNNNSSPVGGTIFAVRDKAPSGLGTAILSINDQGTTVHRMITDSTTAFQLQDASSTSVFTFDSTNTQITIRGNKSVATVGSELFSSGSCSGTNWSGTGPWTHATGSTAALSCTPPASLTADATYQVTFSATGNSNSGQRVAPSVGGTSGQFIDGLSSTVQLITAGGTTNLQFTPGSTWNGQIDSISLKLVTTANNVLAVQNSDASAGLEVRAGGAGLNNSFIGVGTGLVNTTGTNNTGLGYQALQSNEAGSNNTALGQHALQSNVSGSQNVAIGAQALSSNVAGINNVAIGQQALNANLTGIANVAIGQAAMQLGTSGNNSVAIGQNALWNNTASGSTGVGTSALQGNTFGTGNAALGYQALQANTTGGSNSALGYQALNAITTTSNNTAIGYTALKNGTGFQNTAIGSQALLSATSGANDVAVGFNALQSLSSGNQNVGVGRQALNSLSTGSLNVGVGDVAGQSISTGSNNTLLGGFAGYLDPNVNSFATTGTAQNSTAIGYGSQVQGSNMLTLGGQGALAVSVGIGTTNPTNTLSVSPDQYDTGTAGTGGSSSTTVTGSGTTWTAAMVGSEFIFADGTKRTITAFGSTTSLTLASAVTEANGSAYRIQQPAFQVTSAGKVGIGTVAPTYNFQVKTQANTTTAAAIQDAAGGNLFAADTTNENITLAASNTGALASWSTNANALPAARGAHSSVTANGYVYVIGGQDGAGNNGQSTVYYAKLNSDGSAGTWSTNANALPSGRSFHSSVVADGYVYVIGGVNSGFTVQSTVYYAKLNSDGSTGAWSTNTNALPAARYLHTSVVANGYVYVIGGNDGSFAAQSTVYYAKLNSDGSTGAWSTNANALPAVRYAQSSVTANGYVYVIGGNNASAAQSTVYYAKLNSDGSTGAWSTNANALPQILSQHSSVTANGYVYVIGGNNGGAQSTVYYAKLNSDGSTGAWSTNANALPQVRYGLSSVVANGYVYAIGGCNGCTNQSTVYYASTSRIQVGGSLDLVGLQGQSLADPGDPSTGSTGGSLTAGNGTFVGSLQVQGQANFSQAVSINGTLTVNDNATFNNAGALASWSTNANTLPAARSSHSSVTANGYVYVIGGTPAGTGSTIATVYYAKLNSDGSTATWNTNTNALPAVRSNHSSVTANGYVYVIGGQNASGTLQSTVYYAKLNSDGSTGTWSTNANALPATLDFHTSVVANGYVYVLGGSNGSAVSTVYYAKLNSDGSIGAWSTNTNALPAAIQQHTSIVANGYVYVMGGVGPLTSVYYAKLNSDGSTGTWSTNANTLPAGLRLASSGVSNGYAYVLGGLTTGNAGVATIYYAKLNSDGSTGAWSTNSNALPQVLSGLSTVVSNGYVYALGGFGASVAQSTVYYASTSRIQIGGSLDLVGLQGQSLADPGDPSAGSTGGSIIAGNGTFVGALQVQGQGSFASGVNINGVLNVGGSATIQTTTNTTTAFQVQKADGTGIFNVDTSGGVVNIQNGKALNILDASNNIAGYIQASGSNVLINTNNFTHSLTLESSGLTVQALSTGNLFSIVNWNPTSQVFVNDSIAGLANGALITNASFEGSASGFGWKGTGSHGTTSTNNSNAYMGSWSLSVASNSSAVAGDGVKSGSVTLTDSTQYTLSFYAKLSSGTMTTLGAGYSSDGATDTDCTLNSNTVSTAYWTRYFCTFTTAASHSGTPYLYMKQTDAGVAHSYFIDAVQIQTGANASAFEESFLTVNGVVNSPAAFHNASNSTTAFQVQNSAGSNLFTVDSANNRIGINTNSPLANLDVRQGANGDDELLLRRATDTSPTGNFLRLQNAAGSDLVTIDISGNLTVNGNIRLSATSNISTTSGDLTLESASTGNIVLGTSDTTGQLLVLDTKTSAGDPTGVDGGMYYNSNSKSFRCQMDGVWSDCAIHNIEHTVYLEDEFTGGDVNSNTVGDLGWAYNAITTNATFSYNDANTAADRPGILHLATTNSSNTGSTMSLATGGNMGWILAANQIFKTSLALSHITNGVVRFGFHDATTGTARPTNGVYFEFNPANNANWEYCSSGGVPCTATTVAPTANTFQRFEIRITAVGAGTSVATFLIDGTSVGTISGATFTANNVAPAYQFFTNTTLVRSLYIDYFQARTVTGAAR